MVRLEAGKDIPLVMLSNLLSVTMADEPLPLTKQHKKKPVGSRAACRARTESLSNATERQQEPNPNVLHYRSVLCYHSLNVIIH